MKSQPDADTTAKQKYETFETNLRQVVNVSKPELAKLEEQYQRDRSQWERRGPKPKSSVSGRVSSDKG